MDSSAWTSDLSSIDRYDIIQRILSALPSHDMQQAIAIEQSAFTTSSSRQEYDAACEPRPPHSSHTSPSSPATPIPLTTTTTTAPLPEITLSDPAISIGPYTDCHPIASGITSTVYRSSSPSSPPSPRALKLITTTRPRPPHNPLREIKILQSLHHPSIIPLLSVFHEPLEHRPVLVFPLMPLTLATLLSSPSIPLPHIRAIFADILAALSHIHSRALIHRDIKPSAILLSSPSGPALLSDFGTAYHPALSPADEPPAHKALDIGSGPYRAPEVLFGNPAYLCPVDMWALGASLAEAIASPPAPLFQSRPAHEDGSQLGLILSIFRTIGTPTPATWPEALHFKVRPFDLWTVFPPRPWHEILPRADPALRDAVARLVRYDGKRATADEALTWECFNEPRRHAE